jgi:hypothetical protein
LADRLGLALDPGRLWQTNYRIAAWRAPASPRAPAPDFTHP